MTRQTRKCSRFALAAMLALMVATASAQEAQPASVPAPVPGRFNVRDFGAKGDGAADDTAAIRAAIKAAFERRRIPQHPKYGYFVSISEVYFPNGHYLISDTMDIENKVTMPDFHATILHTLGLDHEKLTFHHAGRDYRLTDVHGHVVKEILA